MPDVLETPSTDPHRSLRAVTVANPYTPAHYGEASNPRTVPAIVNQEKRHHDVGLTRSDRRRSAYRCNEIPRLVGSDVPEHAYGREPVDGGGRSDPITHRQMHAAEELRVGPCRASLGS